MDRCAVGEPARDASKSLNRKTERANSRACSRDTAQGFAGDFPNQQFPAIHIARVAAKGGAIFQSQ